MVIILLTAVVFCGCSQQKEKNEPPVPPANEQPQQQKSVPQNELLAAFQTVIHDSAESRLHNINLCIKAINGVTLAPGEVFSFNSTVGERSGERGYQKAKVLIDGEYVDDYGGGVCQVSTTIYNASLIAGLETIEHHTHDKPVNYVAEGKDAAVNYDSLDLKIKNNTNSSIKIEVSTNNSKIFASISKIL